MLSEMISLFEAAEAAVATGADGASTGLGDALAAAPQASTRMVLLGLTWKGAMAAMLSAFMTSCCMWGWLRMAPAGGLAAQNSHGWLKPGLTDLTPVVER